MAGDWLKIEMSTPDKPEVHAIAAKLGLSPGETFACLFKVWRWFDLQSRDGHARVTLLSLDSYAGVTHFAQAMLDVGWLSTGQDGLLTMNNFDRHNGKSAKNRALATRRKQLERSRSRHDSVTLNTGPEKRREEVLPPTPLKPSYPQPKANGKGNGASKEHPEAIQHINCRYCTAEAVSQVNGIHHCRAHSNQAYDGLSAIEFNNASSTTGKFDNIER